MYVYGNCIYIYTYYGLYTDEKYTILIQLFVASNVL